VAREEVLHGDVTTLRQRLAAILHFTGLHEQYPVDLHDKYALESSAQRFVVNVDHLLAVHLFIVHHPLHRPSSPSSSIIPVHHPLENNMYELFGCT
jgi:hypothetical protein